MKLEISVTSVHHGLRYCKIKGELFQPTGTEYLLKSFSITLKLIRFFQEIVLAMTHIARCFRLLAVRMCGHSLAVPS